MANVNLSRVAVINYTAVRGDTFAPPPVSFTIDGDPEDFSGGTLKMQVKLGANIKKTLTQGDGISVNSNALQYSIAASDMEQLDAGKYLYDVQKTDGSGIVVTIQAGEILLTDDVTKP